MKKRNKNLTHNANQRFAAGSPEPCCLRNKTTQKLPVSSGVKKGFRVYVAIVLTVTLLMCVSVTAFAATDDPIQVVNNLSDFIFDFQILFSALSAQSV